MTIVTKGMGAIITKLDKLYKHKKGSKHFYVIDNKVDKKGKSFQVWERKFPKKKAKVKE